MKSSAAHKDSTTDGRHARSERTRAAVAEAMLEEVARLQIEQVSRELPPIGTEGTLEQRVDALLANSVCRNELIAPVRRAVLASDSVSGMFKERHGWFSPVNWPGCLRTDARAELLHCAACCPSVTGMRCASMKDYRKTPPVSRSLRV